MRLKSGCTGAQVLTKAPLKPHHCVGWSTSHSPWAVCLACLHPSWQSPSSFSGLVSEWGSSLKIQRGQGGIGTRPKLPFCSYWCLQGSQRWNEVALSLCLHNQTAWYFRAASKCWSLLIPAFSARTHGSCSGKPFVLFPPSNFIEWETALWGLPTLHAWKLGWNLAVAGTLSRKPTKVRPPNTRPEHLLLCPPHTWGRKPAGFPPVAVNLSPTDNEPERPLHQLPRLLQLKHFKQQR